MARWVPMARPCKIQFARLQAFNGSFSRLLVDMCVQKWYIIRHARPQIIDLQGNYYIGVTPFWTCGRDLYLMAGKIRYMGSGSSNTMQAPAHWQAKARRHARKRAWGPHALRAY